MRRLIVMGFVLACAGCATPGDVAKKDPVDSFATAKSPQEFAGCVMPSLLKDMPLTRVVPKQGGQQIIGSASAFGVVAALIDVDAADAGGSTVTVRTGPMIGARNAVPRNARSCQ